MSVGKLIDDAGSVGNAALRYCWMKLIAGVYWALVSLIMGIEWLVSMAWLPVVCALSCCFAFVSVMHVLAPAYIRDEQQVVDFAKATYASFGERFGVQVVSASAGDAPNLSYVSIVERAAIRHGFSEAFGRRVASVESHFNPRSESGKGALGLMQVMPANAQHCGLNKADLLDPEKNAECGFTLLRESFDKYKDARKALLEYNGGPDGVRVVSKCGDNLACMGYESPRKLGFAESYFYARDILNDTATDMRG